MERKTKRIIAIVLVIALAGAGIGVGVWWVLRPEENPYLYPGLGEQRPLAETLKVGVLDDAYWTGKHTYTGAYLAAEDINVAGGLSIGGKTYYVGLVFEDTQEVYFNYDAAKAAALRMVAHDPDMLLGGFRSEVFMTYVSTMMELKVPYFICGCATDAICQDWLGNPFTRPQFKYLFRIMPPNNARMAHGLSMFYNHFLIPDIEAKKLGGNRVNNITIIHEDMLWTTAMKNVFLTELGAYNPYLSASNITVKIIPAITPEPAWFDATWADIKAENPPLVINIISSGTTGLEFGKSYGRNTPNCLIAGINVMAQTNYYQYLTGNNSMYEISTNSFAPVNQSDYSLAWQARYTATDTGLKAAGETPMYSAMGGWDGVNLVANVTERIGTIDGDAIVAELEKFNVTNPHIPVRGRTTGVKPNYWSSLSIQFAFDANHDYLLGDGSPSQWYFPYMTIIQWQRISPTAYHVVVVPTWGYNYTVYDKWMPLNKKADYQYPPWWV